MHNTCPLGFSRRKPDSALATVMSESDWPWNLSTHSLEGHAPWRQRIWLFSRMSEWFRTPNVNSDAGSFWVWCVLPPLCRTIMKFQPRTEVVLLNAVVRQSIASLNSMSGFDDKEESLLYSGSCLHVFFRVCRFNIECDLLWGSFWMRSVSRLWCHCRWSVWKGSRPDIFKKNSRYFLW